MLWILKNYKFYPTKIFILTTILYIIFLKLVSKRIDNNLYELLVVLVKYY